MNILFLMADQLRFDYLGCAGHPTIKTPHIDRLAQRGVRFDKCYVQSPICGPSRMSTYTGRYCHSHGSTWNNVPLRVGEMTIGDHLRPLGMDTVLCGKTHMTADTEGMARLGVAPDSVIGARVSDCGFDPWDRHDGEIPFADAATPNAYQDYLRAKGYDGENPWESWANSGEDPDGTVLSGWLMRHAREPARIKNEDSETPYTTSRAIDYIAQAGDTPWCLHVSYIKPHWPYIVPAPYHAMYGPDDVPPALRNEAERTDPHPLLGAYHGLRFCKVYQDDEVRQTVIPAYMGLITQLDDEIGRLLAYLDETGKTDNTLIVFTSDHGDYLGDHWLGEKELFHEQSVRVPLIICDPSAKADATRGTVSNALVEAIDLAPSFVDVAGGAARPEILEGHSLMPIVHGQTDTVRPFTISEYDYAFKGAREVLGQPIGDCRIAMIYDGRCKLVHVEGFRPMLYDHQTDPDEFTDLGADPAYATQIADLTEQLHSWYRRHHNRTTISDAQIEKRVGGDMRRGIYVGFWTEDDLEDAKKLGRSGN